MHTAIQFSRRGVKALLALAFVAALVMIALPGGKQAEAIAPFSTTTTARYCNGLSATFPDSIPFNDPDLLGSPACPDPGPISASTAYPLTTVLSVPGSHSMPAGPHFTFVPGTTAADATIPNGTKVGAVVGSETASILGGSCSGPMLKEFILYDSATTGVPVAPASEGTADRFGTLITDANADGLADATSTLVTSNLTIYETLFDPDATPGGANGPLPPVAPKARYSGAYRVAATYWEIISVFVFDPGALEAFSDDSTNRPHPFGRLSRAPGDSTLLATVEGDPTEAVPSGSTLLHWCSPESLTTMLLGTVPGAITRYTTPAAGSYAISQYAQGHRDADGDSIDNTQDSCPLDANTGSDPDSDRIDSACDPTPGFNTGSGDHDGDGWLNTTDNCPLAANGGAAQKESEANTGYITAASDGGPRKDGLGDACDPGPTTATGQGAFPENYNLVAKCIGTGTNADADGYCATQDLNDASSGTGGFTLNKGPDQDGVGVDGDQFGANTEIYVGTDPLLECAATSAANDEATDSAPADFDDDGAVDMGDALRLRTVFGGAVPPASSRFDIVPSKSINTTDALGMMTAFRTQACGAGSTPAPTDGPVGWLALDANVSGNDARLTSGASIQTCRSVATSTSFDVDVVIPSPGVVSTDGLAAAEFVLAYNPAVVTVTGVTVPGYLLAAAAGSAVIPLLDSLPDADGSLRVGVADYASPASPEPAGKDETGPGVVMRITLTTGVGTGASALTLTNPHLYSSDEGMMAISAVSGAEIRVGSYCDPIVNSTADTGDLTPEGSCDDGAGNCTLREAIQEANFIAGANTIWFAIGAGAQTISPASALPALSGDTTIDGTTQPGYAGPTPVITLDGSGAGSGAGLSLSGSGNAVKALEIRDFSGDGVTIAGSNNVVNWRNVIHDNSGDGVSVISGTDNSIRPNHLYSNGGLGIDLNGDGLTADDADDADSGPNGLQNHGVMTSAIRSGSNTIMTGYGSGELGSASYTIDLYSNAVGCDASGFGEGQEYLTTFPVTTDANGDVRASGIVAIALTPGQVISHTATDPSGNTSEHSRCVTVVLDSDLDGIEDSVDTSPASFSDSFSDVGLGGTTTGTITARAGLTVAVAPAHTSECAALVPAMTKCLAIGSPGPVPTATATVSMCGGTGTLDLGQNDLVIEGCNSMVTRVQSGPVETHHGTITISMLTGTGTEVTGLGGGQYDVDVAASSTASVKAGGLSIAPGGSATVQDPDGDGLVDQVDPCPTYPSFWTVPVGDTDCDGFTDAAETAMGTLTGDPCGFTPGGASQSETWPPDLAESNSINTTDVLVLKPPFGTPGTPRLDIVPSGSINTTDVLATKPFFGKSCPP